MICDEEEEDVANDLWWEEEEVANDSQWEEEEVANELRQQGLERLQVFATTRRGSGIQKEFSGKQKRVQQQSKQSPVANKKESIIEQPLWNEWSKEQVQHGNESSNLMSRSIQTSCDE